TSSRAGESDANELGCFPDRARVGVGIFLVFLGAGREAVFCGQFANLVEPFLRVIEVLVALDEVVGEACRNGRVNVEGLQAFVGGPSQWGEQLREEKSVGNSEV